MEKTNESFSYLFGWMHGLHFALSCPQQTNKSRLDWTLSVSWGWDQLCISVKPKTVVALDCWEEHPVIVSLHLWLEMSSFSCSFCMMCLLNGKRLIVWEWKRSLCTCTSLCSYHFLWISVKELILLPCWHTRDTWFESFHNWKYVLNCSQLIGWDSSYCCTYVIQLVWGSWKKFLTLE